jgi:flagellar protein FlgJ
MNSATSSTTINALDPRSLSGLQRLAKSNDPGALKAAAQQFEAVFLQMVLKSMRDATPHESPFDNDQSRMFEGLLDQQLAQVMASKRGVGLAAVIERQLQRQVANGAELAEGISLIPAARSIELQPRTGFALPGNTPRGQNAVPPASTLGASPGEQSSAQGLARSFVARVLPDANAAAEQTGIPAAFLIAHAALETGWGRYEPRAGNGTPSFNLFGIKAGSQWTGPTVEANTVEYVQGVAQSRVEKFRAYGSYAESFSDYAKLLNNNPRYSGVLGLQEPEAFAVGLQRAGYATDPNYASKLGRVIESLRTAVGS